MCPARVFSARRCAARPTEAMACAYSARVHLRCGPAHALPCCHNKTRSLQDNLIAELPAGIFDYNVLLEYLYVPAGLRGRPW